MSSPAEFTGERFMPECAGEIWAEHWHRYVFASRLVAALDVLDAACGEGYGAAWLARSARSVTGLDIDLPTVEAARARYARPRLSFEAGSVISMPFGDGSFDCVVSFETLEHLAEQREMMAEMRRVLRPGGFLVISTPNRPEYSERRDFHNAFHVRELDAAEFRALIAERFPAQRWYGQKLLFNSAIWPLTPAETPVTWVAVDEATGMPEPMYYVALAAASEHQLPAIRDTTFLADPDGAMYREYEGTVARVGALERLIESRDRALAERAAHIAHLESLALVRLATINERDRQLDEQAERAQQLEAVVVERDREAAHRDERIAEAERVVQARDRLLEETNGRAAAMESLLVERERIVAERDAQLAAVNARMSDAEQLIAERERIIVERDAQLAAVNARMAFAETLIAQRDAQLAAADEKLAEILQTDVAQRTTWRWWLQSRFGRRRAPRPRARGRTG